MVSIEDRDNFTNLLNNVRKRVGDGWKIVRTETKTELAAFPTTTMSIKLRGKFYILTLSHGIEQKFYTHDYEGVLDTIVDFIEIDPGYRTFIQSKEIRKMNIGIENLLHKLDRMCVEVEYHPQGEKVDELRKEFEELSTQDRVKD
jgi:hypothetical protein